MPITNAAAWRSLNSKAIELELPSGLTVLVRRPPLQMWIAAGKLPENLVRTMLKNHQGGPPQVPDMTPEQFKELFGFMRQTIVATVVQPRIVDPPTSEDEISPDDVPLEDGMFIFQWALAGGQTPTQQRQAMAAVEGGQVQVDATDLRTFRTF
jgi:hypothetical protein